MAVFSKDNDVQHRKFDRANTPGFVIFVSYFQHSIGLLIKK
jgi:hypothetical protein